MAGRIRSIKPELLDDNKACDLSDTAWRLFVSSWLLADDHGNLRADRRYLASQVWQDTTRDADAPLHELAKAGLVRVYCVRGSRYANIPGWARHQRIDNAGKPRVPGIDERDDHGNDPVSERPEQDFAANLGEPPRVAENLRESPRNEDTSKNKGLGEFPRVSANFGGLPLDPDLRTTNRTPTPERAHAHGRTREASPDQNRPEVGGSASPAREELPPVAPASAQQSRDLRAPTRVQAVLAKAYGDGMRRAAPDVPFPDPSEPKDLRELETMAIAKHKSASTIEAQTWVEKSAHAYRLANADRAQYESGFSPTAWARWVKGGGLTQTGTPNAAPPSAQGRFQPVDQSLSPHHPSRRPYKPIVVENDDPTVPIPFPGLTPRPAAVKPKEPVS